MNKFIVMGNLGGDPETRQINGQMVCNFSVATNEKWTDANGVAKEATQWHRITVWGKLAEVCAQYLFKGRKVLVEGRISYRESEKDGVTTRYTNLTATNIDFCDSKRREVEEEKFDDQTVIEQEEKPKAKAKGKRIDQF